MICETFDCRIFCSLLYFRKDYILYTFCIDCLERSLQDEHFENHVMCSNVKETEKNNDGYFGQVLDDSWKNIKDKMEKFKNK